MIRELIAVRARDRSHQEHLLSPSFLFPILSHLLLCLILFTGTFLGGPGNLVFLLLYQLELHLAQLLRPVDLILCEPGSLIIHVALPRLLLLLEFYAFLLSLILLLLDFLLLLLETN